MEPEGQRWIPVDDIGKALLRLGLPRVDAVVGGDESGQLELVVKCNGARICRSAQVVNVGGVLSVDADDLLNAAVDAQPRHPRARMSSRSMVLQHLRNYAEYCLTR